MIRSIMQRYSVKIVINHNLCVRFTIVRGKELRIFNKKLDII